VRPAANQRLGGGGAALGLGVGVVGGLVIADVLHGVGHLC
jgi:hypothetical protein